MKFQIDYPAQPYFVNQVFGVDKKTYSQFGLQGHNGIDLRTKHGQPVYAAHDGVAYHQVDSSEGCGVIVITNTGDYDYKGKQVFFKTIYWHLCDYGKEPQFKSPVLDWQQKNKGKPKSVKKGEIIGYADNTGFSKGDHLHFSLKPMVPSKVLPPSAWDDATDVGIGNWVNVEQTNGFLGSIDPTPYFTGRYANEVDTPLTPADQVAVIAAKTQAEGNSKLATQLWAIVGLIKSFFK